MDNDYLLGVTTGAGYVVRDAITITLTETNAEPALSLFRLNYTVEETPLTTLHHNFLTVVAYNAGSDAKRELGPCSCDKLSDAKRDSMTWTFIAGLYDSCGILDENGPVLEIHCRSKDIVKTIRENFFDDGHTDELKLWYCGADAVDFLSQMYDGCGDYFSEHRYQYFVNGILERRVPNMGIFQVKRESPDAVVPFKGRFSDAGYDLTVVKLNKTVGPVYFYDTCITVACPFGYYFEVVPRSSLVKKGYMLANSVGIIDNSYRGTVIIALVKMSADVPDLQLPDRCCQLIPRKSTHVVIEEVDDINKDTNRGIGAFGSTG